MNLPARMPADYSRAERLSDAAVHVAGIIAALIAVPVLITLAAIWIGDRTTVIAALIYGASLIAMLACSALYNIVPTRRDMLRRIDQSAIYIKIAGTYTPFAVLTGTQTGFLLTGLWTAALVGAAMILFGRGRLRYPSLALYLGMGWAGALAGGPLLAELSPAAVSLIFAGGMIYTLGVGFFLWERLPFHNTIWHVFVLTASGVIYCAVVVEFWHRAA